METVSRLPEKPRKEKFYFRMQLLPFEQSCIFVNLLLLAGNWK